jgi:hypothetical protein
VVVVREGPGVTSVVVVHFPDGSREFRYPNRMFERGDVLSYDGERYCVVDIALDGERCTVRVELDSDDIGDLLRSERGAIELEPV